MKTHISPFKTLSYIIKTTKPFPSHIFVMFVVAIVWAVDISIRPYILKVMLNKLAEGSQQNIFSDLAFSATLYILLSFVMATVYRMHSYFVEIKMVPRMREQIANNALGLLLDKSHTFYQNNYSGSLANKVNDLTSSIPDVIQMIIDRFFSHFLALIVAIYTLWAINSVFAIVMILWSVIFLIGAFAFSKYFSDLARIWSSYGSTITGKMVDTLSNILSVRLFSAKNQEKKNLHEICDQAVHAEQNLQWALFWMWFWYGYSFAFIQGVNLYFLLKGRQDGWITIGDFALVLSINTAIVDFLWQVAQEFSKFSKYFGRITQALESILDPQEMKDAPGAGPLVVSQGTIAFDNVTFNYKGAPALFEKTSIVIPSGQKVGLVGYSGGGKTTFVNLILRFYDVTEGAILIDNQDIRTVTQDSLRAAIGMIPQDPSLFARTLMENIRYGRPAATDDEVIEAAQRAYAHEFISKLPQGYQTTVGERGVKLSGGQRQRIAIARAILKNAPILMLDEATSQLDSVTESAIQASLWTLMQGKTTIVVAHRLSTLLHMDRILVFDAGKIIQDGTHQQLVMQEGLYKTLWQSQIGGFLPDKIESDDEVVVDDEVESILVD